MSTESEDREFERLFEGYRDPVMDPSAEERLWKILRERGRERGSERVPRAPERRLRFRGLATVAAALLVFSAVMLAVLSPLARPGPEGGPAAPQEKDDEKVRDLVKRLAADDPAERETAAGRLKEMGARILPILRREHAGATDPEVRARLATLIDVLGRPSIDLVKELELDLGAGPVIWSPDGKRLAVAADRTVRVYETGRWSEVHRLDVAGQVVEMAFSPDGGLLALQQWPAGSLEAEIVISAADALRPLATFKSGVGAVDVKFLDEERVAFVGVRMREPQGNYLSVARRRGDAWQAEELDPLISAEDMGVSADGKWLAIFDDGKIEVRHAGRLTERKATQELAGEARFGRRSGWGLVFSPDGSLLVLKGFDGRLHAFEAATLRELKVWVPNGKTVDFSFTGDSRYLLTCGSDLTLRLWRIEGWKEAASMAVEAAETLQYVSASPAGGLLALFGGEHPRRIRIYRLREP